MRQRSKVACVVGQVMIYNTIKYGSPSQSTVQIHHSIEHESPPTTYRMIVFVIVPPGNLGRMDLFMPKIEDGNVIRPSHYSIPGLR